jgi:hypothetical protein
MPDNPIQVRYDDSTNQQEAHALLAAAAHSLHGSFIWSPSPLEAGRRIAA